MPQHWPPDEGAKGSGSATQSYKSNPPPVSRGSLPPLLASPSTPRSIFTEGAAALPPLRLPGPLAAAPPPGIRPAATRPSAASTGASSSSAPNHNGVEGSFLPACALEEALPITVSSRQLAPHAGGGVARRRITVGVGERLEPLRSAAGGLTSFSSSETTLLSAQESPAVPQVPLHPPGLGFSRPSPFIRRLSRHVEEESLVSHVVPGRCVENADGQGSSLRALSGGCGYSSAASSAPFAPSVGSRCHQGSCLPGVLASSPAEPHGDRCYSQESEDRKPSPPLASYQVDGDVGVSSGSARPATASQRTHAVAALQKLFFEEVAACGGDANAAAAAALRRFAEDSRPAGEVDSMTEGSLEPQLLPRSGRSPFSEVRCLPASEQPNDGILACTLSVQDFV